MNNKKILIVSLTFPPMGDATANIIGKLINKFKAHGCEVSGLALKTTDSDKTEYNGINVYHINHKQYSILSKSRKIGDRIKCLMMRINSKLPNWWKKGSYHEYEARAIYKAMKKFYLSSYDAVLCVCAYYSAIEGVLRYKKASKSNFKVLLLQVDPLTDNLSYPQRQYEKRKAYEKKLYENCDYVFTTPIIYDNIEKNGFRKDNVSVVEFPLVEKPCYSEDIKIQDKKENEIRCVFAGYLYPNIRDAKYTLELFSKFKNENIKLYILGTGQEELLKSYENGSLKGRLIRLGSLSSNVCNAWLKDADVLVNIGNSVLNQVPSKIFDYVSRGKCILNICKSEKCPTLRYLNKYPLAINIIEGKDLNKEDFNRIEQLIINIQWKIIDYNKVEEIFYDCTPQYVAETILEKV
ncbi:MAG: hypothetical protein IKA85_02520 [Clostridia bacterium]|nr:hypothetical protein [Clostridia bacterium]